MLGSLTHNDYQDLVNNKNICEYSNINQIQPASFDLTLSNECYEVNSSFLSPKTSVREKLNSFSLNKFDINKNNIFSNNKIYIVRLNEKLNLSKEIGGNCNPKSSTGRLDIFCRVILDYCDEYCKHRYIVLK